MAPAAQLAQSESPFPTASSYTPMTITAEVTVKKLVEEGQLLAQQESQSLYEAGFRLGAVAALVWVMTGENPPSDRIRGML